EGDGVDAAQGVEEDGLVAAGVSPQARGESLTVEEFARIAENKGAALPETPSTPSTPSTPEADAPEESA
ncbi:hypothetical protein ACVNF4_36465, partial [Streptomyces sp. S6]